MIHVEVWQKITKFYKAIILQLKNKLILKNFKKEGLIWPLRQACISTTPTMSPEQSVLTYFVHTTSILFG